MACGGEGSPPPLLIAHDLATDGVDFRDLPHPDRSFDTVCFDPPYLPQGGVSSGVPRDAHFRASFGLSGTTSQRELEALVVAGLTECARVTRGLVLAKCCDYTNGRQFHLGHLNMIRAAETAGLRCHDLIVHASGSGPGGGQIRTPKRARRAHSYLLVFTRAGRS